MKNFTKNFIKYSLIIFALLIITPPKSSAAMIAYETAMKSTKPFALYIYMNGCPYCRMFDPVFEKLSQKYSYKYNFVRAEYRNGIMPQLCQKWNVRGFPFMALMNPKTNSGKRVSNECLWDDNCLIKSFQTFP